MDFNLNEDQQAYRDAARDFSDKEFAPKAAEWDAGKIFPRDVISQAGELGLALPNTSVWSPPSSSKYAILACRYRAWGPSACALTKWISELLEFSVSISTVSGSMPTIISQEPSSSRIASGNRRPLSKNGPTSVTRLILEGSVVLS